ncbi:MAG: hypothetical protein AAFP69_03990 [Planctomycetota bacterium]
MVDTRFLQCVLLRGLIRPKTAIEEKQNNDGKNKSRRARRQKTKSVFPIACLAKKKCLTYPKKRRLGWFASAVMIRRIVRLRKTLATVANSRV